MIDEPSGEVWALPSGIPVVGVPREGHTSAALVFRVGIADEELTQRGITHMVEHCVAGQLRDRHLVHQAEVRVSVTAFTVRGSAQDTADFLLGIGAALAAFPADRIEHERRVLRAEEHELGSRWTSVGGLFGRRWGARSWGLRDYEQAGLFSLEEDEIRQWAAHWFTAGNCVLVLHGELPPAFDLALPEGPRRPCPDTRPLPGPYPAFDGSDRALMAMSMTGPETADFSGGGRCLGRRLHDRLRQREGISYGPDFHYEPLDSATAHLTLWARALPESAGILTSAFFEEVERFVDEGPRTEEIDRLRVDDLRLEPSRLKAIRVSERAYDLLMDRQESPDVLDSRQYDSVRMAEAFRHAIKTAIAVLPEGGEAPEGWRRLPRYSPREATGTNYRRLEPPDDASAASVLVVGDDGVTLRTPEGPWTVLFQECAAVLVWRDRWLLVGRDGCHITLDAGWESGDEIFNKIRERMPTRCWVHQEADTIEPISGSSND